MGAILKLAYTTWTDCCYMQLIVAEWLNTIRKIFTKVKANSQKLNCSHNVSPVSRAT